MYELINRVEIDKNEHHTNKLLSHKLETEHICTKMDNNF